MVRIHSFDPLADTNAEILILGTMPGRASLAADQYYAHSRNAFWPILCELLQFDITSKYEMKVQALKSSRIAIWDVLNSCARLGSLDAKIELNSLIINDFYKFFQAHSYITHVFFNGAKAESYFMRYVLPNIDSSHFKFFRLPSTSPAYASMNFDQKLDVWRAILVPNKVNY